MISSTKIKYYLKLLLGRHPWVKRDIRMPTERYGTEYGGWTIKKDSVQADSIVYSIGIGEDISFDLGLMHTYGCKIFAYDPTPKVIHFLQGQQVPGQFIFHPVGLAASDGKVEFFTPDNPDHVSHSARPGAEQKGKMVSFQVNRLSTLMNQNRHTHIDLLKMDIEGFEYGVIENILGENLDIRQVLLEFHHGMYGFTNRDTLQTIAALRKSGYLLFAISDSGREYSFIKTQA